MKQAPSSIEKPLKNLVNFSLPRPHDLHLHLRSGNMMRSVVMFSASVFKYAVVMPNLLPPVEKVSQALAYKKSIDNAIKEEIVNAKRRVKNPTIYSKNALQRAASFSPKFALFLTKYTSEQEIKLAKQRDEIIGYKLYPYGVTTNSRNNPFEFTDLYKVFAHLEKNGVPLLLHGEVLLANSVDLDDGARGEAIGEVDVFEREEVFLCENLAPMVKHFPALKITLEHVSTKAAVQFVKSHVDMAATITVHHLMATRNHMLGDGIRPHLYCKPILKTEEDRLALLEVAISGHPQFFLGTDSAPHSMDAKENCCGAAGVFSSPYAMPLLAQIFAENNSTVAALQAFSSTNGETHYNLLSGNEKIKLVKKKGISLASMLSEQKFQPMHRLGEEIVPFGSDDLCYRVE